MKMVDSSDNIYILNDNNNSKCPYGTFCLGKGNVLKTHKSHSSANNCPMYKMLNNQFAPKFVYIIQLLY